MPNLGLECACQPWAAWNIGDPLRLCFGDRQQWICLCRPQRQHALVQLLRSAYRDVSRPLHDDHSHAWRSRAIWRVRRSSLRPPAPFPVTTPLFTIPADLGDRHRRRTHLLPCAVARPHPGAPAAARRPHLLRHLEKPCLPQVKPKESAACSTPQSSVVRLVDALVKLAPQNMMKNPVMFVVEVGSVLTTRAAYPQPNPAAAATSASTSRSRYGSGSPCSFANFAEAMAEGRGKAQADALRLAKSETTAYRLNKAGEIEEVASSALAR